MTRGAEPSWHLMKLTRDFDSEEAIAFSENNDIRHQVADE